MQNISAARFALKCEFHILIWAGWLVGLPAQVAGLQSAAHTLPTRVLNIILTIGGAVFFVFCKSSRKTSVNINNKALYVLFIQRKLRLIAGVNADEISTTLCILGMCIGKKFGNMICIPIQGWYDILQYWLKLYILINFKKTETRDAPMLVLGIGADTTLMCCIGICYS